MKKLITLLLCLPLLGLSQNITDSLLLYYPMDGNADDYSGNNFHGTVNGALLAPDHSGIPNSAYYFDGINDYIEFPVNDTLKPQNPLTISFWVNLDMVSSQQKFINTDYVVDNYVGVGININNSGFVTISTTGGNGFCNSSNRVTFTATISPLSAGVWYHITGVIKSSTDMEIYVNCKDALAVHSSGTGPSTIAYSNNAPGNLGRADCVGAPKYFQGYMDEIGYWNRALNLSEILELCEKPIINTTRYDCLNGSCVNLGQGVGLFSSLADCQLACQPLGIENENNNIREIRKIVDLLGREVNPSETQNSVLFYLYNDGTVEKKVIMQ